MYIRPKFILERSSQLEEHLAQIHFGLTNIHQANCQENYVLWNARMISLRTLTIDKNHVFLILN